MITVKVGGSITDSTVQGGNGNVHVVDGDVSGLVVSGGDVYINGKKVQPNKYKKCTS